MSSCAGDAPPATLGGRQRPPQHPAAHQQLRPEGRQQQPQVDVGHGRDMVSCMAGDAGDIAHAGQLETLADHFVEGGSGGGGGGGHEAAWLPLRLTPDCAGGGGGASSPACDVWWSDARWRRRTRWVRRIRGVWR